MRAGLHHWEPVPPDLAMAIDMPPAHPEPLPFKALPPPQGYALNALCKPSPQGQPLHKAALRPPPTRRHRDKQCDLASSASTISIQQAVHGGLTFQQHASSQGTTKAETTTTTLQGTTTKRFTLLTFKA